MNWLGTAADEVRPWLSTGFLGAILFIVARLGKPVTDYLIETHRIAAQEKKDDRDGYGPLIATLQDSIRTMETKHADEMRAMRAEHAAHIERITRETAANMARIEGEHRRCEDRLAKIEGELMGFHRQALIQSQQGVAALPASKMVRDAGERAVEAIDRMTGEQA